MPYSKYRMDSKSILDNIKCDFFIPKIFDFMQKNIALNIAKYNKILQKKLNITIKNFSDFKDLYLTTKIEITPIKNKYGKFINVYEKKKKYYHIYFNDNKEEIKNKYSINEEDKVTKIKISIDYNVKSLEGLFNRCNCIETINFKNYCRKGNCVENIFSGCSSLKEISVSNFYKNNTAMNSSFSGCSSLQKVNLCNFYNNSITNVDLTFSGCTSLKEVNAYNFFGNRITTLNKTFFGCTSLQKLNLSNFQNNRITVVDSTYSGCSSLSELNASNFNGNSITSIRNTFVGCNSLKKINYSNFQKNFYWK